MQPLTPRVKKAFLTSFRKKRLIFVCKLRCDVPFWRLQKCPQLPMTAARDQLHPTILKTRNRFVLNRARGFESHHLHQTRKIRTYFQLEKGSDFSFSSDQRMKAPVEDTKLRHLVIDRKPITRIGGCDYNHKNN